MYIYIYIIILDEFLSLFRKNHHIVIFNNKNGTHGTNLPRINIFFWNQSLCFFCSNRQIDIESFKGEKSNAGPVRSGTLMLLWCVVREQEYWFVQGRWLRCDRPSSTVLVPCVVLCAGQRSGRRRKSVRHPGAGQTRVAPRRRPRWDGGQSDSEPSRRIPKNRTHLRLNQSSWPWKLRIQESTLVDYRRTWV